MMASEELLSEGQVSVAVDEYGRVVLISEVKAGVGSASLTVYIEPEQAQQLIDSLRNAVVHAIGVRAALETDELMEA